MMSSLHDLRYTIRKLAARPGFAVVTILTLALGIGATSTVFSVVNGVLLRPLPYPEAERVLIVWEQNPELGLRDQWASPADFRDWRERNQVFEALAAWHWRTFNARGGGGPQRLGGYAVSAGFFAVMGVDPVLGRGFLPDEDRPGAEKVVVLSEGLWQRLFGADPRIVGQNVVLDSVPYTVVGVAPAAFDYPGDAELWTPVAFDYEREPRGFRYAMVAGRLRPGVTEQEAQGELERIAAQLASEYPETNDGWGVRVEPLKERVVKRIRPALLVLFVAVGFVLLIASANVASLLLARMPQRRREVSIRLALGASRRHLLRQFFTEGLVLAVLGGGLGLLVAVWGTETLLSVFAKQIPRAGEVSIDRTVLVFTLAVSAAAGLLCSLAPALRASATRLTEPLRAAGNGTADPASGRLRKVLVAAEVALAVVLLVGTSLLARSFANLLAIDPGFSGEGVLTIELNLPEEKYKQPAQQAAFYRELVPRVAALPGVAAAGTVHPMPLLWGSVALPFAIEGRQVPASSKRPQGHPRLVSPGYFETLDIPLLGGRYFSAADDEDALPVAVVSRTFAKRYFEDQGALGRRITFGDPTAEDARWLTIVGIVGDVRFERLTRQPEPEIYEAVVQRPFVFTQLVLRTDGDPMSLAGPVRRVVEAVDPELPLANVRRADDILAEVLGQPRFSMTLMTLFATAALALASIGVFGVLSVAVSQRLRELGIRLALGARGSDLARTVIGEGLAPVVAGLAAGVAAAAGLTQLLTSQLHGVSATDPLVFAAVPLILLLVAAVASSLPVRRATRVDPIAVLRHE